jgi:hypothetical protein
MPTAVVIAQSEAPPSPILPTGNEALWAVVAVLLPLVVAVTVLLTVRYLRRLRRSADEAVERATAAEREVAALRGELLEDSA